MSVARCQAEVDSREFAEWMAYYRIDPWGEDRADLRSGVIAAVIANQNRKRGSKAFKPGDFMFAEGQRRRIQSNEQIKQTMMMFARVHNADIAARSGE